MTPLTRIQRKLAKRREYAKYRREKAKREKAMKEYQATSLSVTAWLATKVQTYLVSLGASSSMPQQIMTSYGPLNIECLPRSDGELVIFSQFEKTEAYHFVDGVCENGMWVFRAGRFDVSPDRNDLGEVVEPFTYFRRMSRFFEGWKQTLSKIIETPKN